MRVDLLFGLIALLGVAACASTDLIPHGAQGAMQLDEDEKRIWNRSLEEQQRLDRSGQVYEDPGLVVYVNEVAQKLTPDDVKRTGLAFQIKILRNPLLNAFAYSNGVLYVHTGILAKMENEAQLATLLGHEMNHVIHRHATRNMRSVKNTTAVLATVQVAATPFGVFGGLAGLLGVVGATAAVTGYSRALETEADREGLGLVVRAGYDPQESPKLFYHLKRDLEEQKLTEPFFFGTHPRLQERIDSYADLLAGTYAGKIGERFEARFQEKMVPLILENAKLDLSLGRFGSAQKGFEKVLQKQPDSSKARFYLGELYRQRDEKGDHEKAKKEYMLAVEAQPTYADPHRALGYLYMRQSQKSEALAEFGRYLGLAPEASDRAYVEQHIQELTGK